MRTLIYVPILHGEADLGMMAEEIRRQFSEAFGEQEWASRRSALELMWTCLRDRLLSMPIPWERTRLYHDGLPACGYESQIVRALNEGGSPDHKLVVELMERGAMIMGTESAELMIREYRRIQRLAEAVRSEGPGPAVEALIREGEELLLERDAHIARTIQTTLADGEVGVLFLGLLHRVDELLGGELEIQYVLCDLPFGADLWRSLKEQRR